ncbi:MAG: Nif3-like dinuclear metal center hexameric protein [Bacteroides sp.]|nr:Nif3-like dinuclear metal center hexameric protein [Bacteroides sp.]
MTSIRNIIEAIEEAAPRSLQEQWDNSGLLCGRADVPCSGVMVCLDVTPEVVAQAIENHCNLIISHHPLIFKGIKAVSDTTPQGLALIMAIKNDVAVYCAHTSLDNAPAPWGVSHEMASMLGATVDSVISPTGTGVIATLPAPMAAEQFIDRVKETFTAPCVRHSALPSRPISKVALGSGACGFLIPDAIAAGAQAIVTSDVRYHDFLDFGKAILIVDLTHFDTEKITKAIFKRIISQKISNFAPVICASEPNPIEFK